MAKPKRVAKPKPGDPNRPHRCTVETAPWLGGRNGHDLIFPTHHDLIYHLIRDHIISARSLPGCHVDCPMLDTRPTHA